MKYQMKVWSLTATVGIVIKNVTHRRGKKKKKKKKNGASGSSVDPPPDSLAILTFWRPSDHWVSSGFVGPNRSQPYALSAPHYYLSALELQTWQLQQERRR